MVSGGPEKSQWISKPLRREYFDEILGRLKAGRTLYSFYPEKGMHRGQVGVSSSEFKTLGSRQSP
jgi:hypothetical protein